MRKQGTDEDETKFRLLRLRLVKEKTQHDQLVDKVADKYEMDKDSILSLRELLNQDLKKKGFRGQEIFDFVLEEGEDLEEIKLDKRKKDLLRKRHFELEGELAQIKSRFEKKLRETNDL
jgi:hypothetical protein